jgi:hypothetical protein
VIVAVDPGIDIGCGVALFDEGGELLAARFVPRRGETTLLQLAVDVRGLVIVIGGTRATSALVVEKPQVYALGKGSKGDPAGLIDLALFVGMLAGKLPHGLLVLPQPAEWKKQLPKAISHRRARWQLSPEERARIEKRRGERTQGDVLDAVALGLWHCFKAGKRERKPPEPGDAF